MQTIISDTKQEIKQEEKYQNKTKYTILGFSLWRIFGYFIVYSFFGYLVEIIYGLITKGVLESAQSFMYGPFCAIYGLGAVVMILFLQHFKSNNNRLFFGGLVVGSIVEYLVSLFRRNVASCKMVGLFKYAIKY